MGCCCVFVRCGGYLVGFGVSIEVVSIDVDFVDST